MFSTSYKRPLVTLAIVGGLFVAAAPASAKTESPKDQLSGSALLIPSAGSDTVQQAPNGYSWGVSRPS